MTSSMHSPNKRPTLAARLLNYYSKPPILFPLAALFQLIFTLLAVISLYPTPLSQRDWLRPLGMLLFTLLSIGLCGMRKSIAMAYVVLTIVSVILLYLSPSDSPGYILGDSFFPFNVIVSFFVLLLFGKFTNK